MATVRSMSRFFSWPVLLTMFFAVFTLGILSGCGGQKEVNSKQEKPKFEMESLQVDQVSRLDTKIPDGQYLVVKAKLQNLQLESRVLNPNDFTLRNITDKKAEQYSQPVENLISNSFSKKYGPEKKEKLMAIASIQAHPQLRLERYFVFMVPLEARPDQYELFYKPLSMAIPLVSRKTILHDNRHDEDPTAAQPSS